MTSKGRAAVVVVLVVLFAGAATTALYLREKEEEAAVANDADASTDASTDARKVAAKTKGTKKRGARGGKTKVTARPAAQPAKAQESKAQAAPTQTAAPDNTPPNDDDQGSAPAPPRPHMHRSYPSGPSYESAIASNNQQLSMGANNGPDLSDAQLSGPMSDGSFIDECDAPDDMGITVKVAIRSGRAVGVTVLTSPPSGEVAGCIAHHVRGLSWPSSPKMDSFVTTY